MGFLMHQGARINDPAPWRLLSKKAAAAADMPGRLKVTHSGRQLCIAADEKFAGGGDEHQR
jgi:hypothetical protein